MQDKYPYDEPEIDLSTGEEVTNDLQGEDNTTKEDEPVKFNKVKTCFIFVAFLIVVMIVIMTIRSCSISKEVNSQSNEQIEQTQQSDSNNVITSTRSTDSEKLENATVEDGLDSSGVDSSNEANISDISGDTENNSSNGEITDVKESEEGSSESGLTLQEVSEPQLSENINVQAVVASKSIFLSEAGSYVYQVDFLVLTDDNGSYNTLSYFCPKTTYDALTKGDSVNVEYQSDSSGNISISSVSR